MEGGHDHIEESKIGLGLAIGSHENYPISHDHKLHILFPPKKEGEGEEKDRQRKRSQSMDRDDDESIAKENRSGGGGGNKKLRLSPEQVTLLEDTFREHNTLNGFQKQELAEKLNLRPRQIEVWFQNRRARNKLKQMEVDFQLLKKWCETLNEENRRLKKELQELKLRVKQPEGSVLHLDLPPKVDPGAPTCKKCTSGDSSIANE
ncbi:uncharacterized protein A4U43_C05F35070 [Asparagus officinalis]|uniref:Homeobox domain-containing protein n=1 Tax=Asparagus officinalis TaxID=4686 RepID=A0A5P1F2C2_ASPOF|nr:homeobox-leucine zipper protein HOX1-like [Asparagus officinalis]ONK70570.1 uncharacterized protein A4U43_C05F35070 [Asparagus officinalis]